MYTNTLEKMLLYSLTEFYFKNKEIKLINALDFQEIFTFCNPYDREAKYHKVIAYVLRHPIKPFVILEGTLNELIVYFEKRRYRLDRSKRYFESSLLKRNKENLMGIAKRTFFQEYSAIRLKELLSSNFFHDLSELVEIDKDLNRDEKLFRQFFGYLNEKRTKKEKFLANQADAMNLSDIINLNNIGCSITSVNKKRGFFISLLTHTPTLWEFNPTQSLKKGLFLSDYGKPFPRLLKWPMYELLTIFLLKTAGDSINHAINLAEQGLELCIHMKSEIRYLHRNRSNLDVLQQFANAYDLHEIQLEQFEHISIVLDRLYKELSKWKQTIFDDFETILESDELFELNKELKAPDIERLEHFYVSRALSTRNTLIEISELLTQKINKKPPYATRNLSNIYKEKDVEKLYSIGDRHALVERGKFLKLNPLILDIYIQKYFCVLWPTRMTLKEFLKYVTNKIIVNLLKIYCKDGVLKEGKTFKVTYLGQTAPIRINFSSVEELLEILNKDLSSKSSFIRINTPIADFSYLFAGVTSDSQNITIVSHLNISQVIADMLCISNRYFSQLMKPYVNTYLTKKLKAFPEINYEDKITS